ncbi:MAG TPA: GntR family transcriptional regulator [Sulfurimonas sp. UBA12504]|nr:MAG: GntR family transcriptional regulator [Sulfurimonas sp. GWF2_37_8]DAB30410.1 MAG TPA: GntR family transcriptional regulator [Sulfurimonas sp. UBA12504]
MFYHADLAKLLLRLSVGVMMLFHGIHKIIHGIDGIKTMTLSAGLPEVVAYGVYVGEVLMPLLIILGFYARVASLVLAFNMFAAIYLAYGDSFFTLSKHGGPNAELALFYLVASIAIFLLGSGKYGVNSR